MVIEVEMLDDLFWKRLKSGDLDEAQKLNKRFCEAPGVFPSRSQHERGFDADAHRAKCKEQKEALDRARGSQPVDPTDSLFRKK